MRFRRPPFFAPGILCFVLLGTSAAAAKAPYTKEDMTRLADAFYSTVGLEPGGGRAVKDLTIRKDLAIVTLKQGTLYLAKPVEGIQASAVFLGEGSLSISPVRPMDKECMNIAASEHFKKQPGGRFVSDFSEMVVISFDGTLAGLLKELQTSEGPDAERAGRILKDRIDQIRAREEDSEESGHQMPLDLALVENASGTVSDGPFLLQVNSKDFGWVQFIYDDHQTYEVRLSGFENVGTYSEERPLLVTHKASDLDTAGRELMDALKDQKEQVDVQSYKMDITIPDTQHFLVEGKLTFSPLRDGLHTARFDLINYINSRTEGPTAKHLRVLQITDAAGTPLPFIHRKHMLVVALPTPPAAGDSVSLGFSLDEQTIVQLSSVHYLVLNDYPWFPQHGYGGGKYTMDWTIKAKKPLYATGSGGLIQEDLTDRVYNVTRLSFEKEVAIPSLIFGQYQKVTDVYTPKAGGTKVNLAVFSWPQAQFNVLEARPPQTVEVTVPSGKPKDILNEAKQIIEMGESLYGPFPYSSLNVVQMSPNMGFGQSPPGLVQLTGEAFMSAGEIANFSNANADFFHEFFSHEVGHQWWGHVIPWAADEDVWLSESLAEYNAGLYVMALLGPDRFQGKLKEWRDNARIADPHGSIAWADNIRGMNAQQYRIGLLYNKGPYVVHMLRSQVGHENFLKALRNLIEKHRFKPTTTDDLKREFELVVGYKLDFFFDQWFRSTGIPTFDYSTSIHQADDGKWVASVKISQRDKDHLKVVSMPVFFHFGKDKVVVKDRPILTAEDLYQIKLPEKPEKITLDDHKTLLADIVSQDPAGQ